MAKDYRTLGLFEERQEVVSAAEDDPLRYYQAEARSSAYSLLKTNASTLIVMATGLGKTVLFSSIIRHWKEGRVLVLAHREELIEQARKSIESITGEPVEIEQGQLYSGKARIVVGSVQTVYRDNRLERLARNGGFSLVVADEAHHYTSPTYRKVLEHFKEAKTLGVTATPDRADAKALGMIFESVAYSMDLRDGIEAGYLVPLRGREIELTGVDLDGIDTSNGDLAAGQLDEVTLAGVEGIVKGMLANSGERQGIVFFPGVHSANVAAARFNAIKPGCAVAIDGKTDKDLRRKIVADYKAGRVQFLANCMVATEGFDAPNASVIGLARPTKSRALYAQMVGRGTRVLPGVVDSIEGKERAEERRSAIAGSRKPECMLLDFVGNNTKHALVTPEDLLGGRYDDDVKKRAKKIRKESPDGDMRDVSEVLEEAKEQVSRERMELAAKNVRSHVSSLSREFDPFKMLGVDRDRDEQFIAEYGFKPMSDGQRTFLEKSGFSKKALNKTSSKAASQLIGSIIDRRKKGLMSHRQAAMLQSHGVNDMSLNTKQASIAISYVRGNKNVDPMVLRELVSKESF